MSLARPDLFPFSLSLSLSLSGMGRGGAGVEGGQVKGKHESSSPYTPCARVRAREVGAWVSPKVRV